MDFWAWLSSNEEFEFTNINKSCLVIIYLDYLPMRNLNVSLVATDRLMISFLIIFQWGIWIQFILNFIFLLKPWLSSNEEFEYVKWFWVQALQASWLSSNEEFECISFILLISLALTWLSSNEEFEFMNAFSSKQNLPHLIIFQWGIWMRELGYHQAVCGILDYLPMRNLNFFFCQFDYFFIFLDYLPMRNLNTCASDFL